MRDRQIDDTNTILNTQNSCFWSCLLWQANPILISIFSVTYVLKGNCSIFSPGGSLGVWYLSMNAWLRNGFESVPWRIWWGEIFKKFLEGQIRSALICVYLTTVKCGRECIGLPLSWQQMLFFPWAQQEVDPFIYQVWASEFHYAIPWIVNSHILIEGYCVFSSRFQ